MTDPMLPFDILPETLTEPPLIARVRLNRRWLTQEELREARAKGAAWYAAERAKWYAAQQAANADLGNNLPPT
jgi:hypothetical protein